LSKNRNINISSIDDSFFFHIKSHKGTVQKLFSNLMCHFRSRCITLFTIY